LFPQNEGQRKFGAHCGPIRHHRAKSEAVEHQTSGAGAPLLEPPYRLAVAIFRDSTRAFADGDYELARTLKLKDRERDALTNDLNEKLVERATADSELVPSYVDLIFIARALERIGDHATNIAEDSFWRDQATISFRMLRPPRTTHFPHRRPQPPSHLG
jgi:phosphate uptake regulator